MPADCCTALCKHHSFSAETLCCMSTRAHSIALGVTSVQPVVPQLLRVSLMEPDAETILQNPSVTYLLNNTQCSDVM